MIIIDYSYELKHSTNIAKCRLKKCVYDIKTPKMSLQNLFVNIFTLNNLIFKNNN